MAELEAGHPDAHDVAKFQSSSLNFPRPSQATLALSVCSQAPLYDSVLRLKCVCSGYHRLPRVFTPQHEGILVSNLTSAGAKRRLTGLPHPDPPFWTPLGSTSAARGWPSVFPSRVLVGPVCIAMNPAAAGEKCRRHSWSQVGLNDLTCIPRIVQACSSLF